MLTLRSFTFSASLLFLSIFSTSSHAIDNGELEVIRSYFTVNLMAASDGFECFTDNEINQINDHLQSSRGDPIPDPSEMTPDDLIVYDGAKLINRMLQISDCNTLASTLTRVDMIMGADDASDFDLKLLARQFLLILVDSFTIEASMMNHLNYGDPDIFSGDANNLFYDLARDQIEFSLLLMNVIDFEDIDTKYLYKFFLERSDELLENDSEDPLVRRVSPSVGKIYQKMALLLMDAESNENESDLFEQLLDFLIEVNPHIYAVNKAVVDSLPQGI